MYKKIKIPSVFMPLLLAVFFICGVNMVLLSKIWDALNVIDGTYTSFAFTIPLFLLAVFNFVITLFSARWLFKPLFVFLILFSSFLSYGMHTYGIVFDKNMIVNIMETNPGEASSYMNGAVIGWVFLFGVIPSLLLLSTDIIYPSLRRSIAQKTLSMGISLIIIALIALFHFQDYASFIRNNPTLRKEVAPTYALDSIYGYTKRTFFPKKIPYIQIGLNASQRDPDVGSKKELVVLVVGETQRSMNYELNGYKRPTNKYTKQQGIISFPHTTSCGTATAVSVPCMFSNLTQNEYNKENALSRDDLLDVVKRSDVHVLWLDNDSGCKDVCKHVETIDVHELYKADKKQCVGDGCHDSVLLEELSKRFDTLPDQTALVVLHIMGSHGPTYFNRYPADHRVFKPDCQRSDIQNCTHKQLVNSYDNSILYSDYIMSGIIDLLKKKEKVRNSTLLFMSDHGESLGEKGLYLHGMPYSVAPEEQTHVPFLTWMSQGFADDRGIDLACVREKLPENQYSHDNLFHTVLGLLAVDVDVYKKDMDVFTPCKTGIADRH
jgi:lipid A ethanolaminephosphotransferase